MKLQQFILIAFLSIFVALPLQVHADTLVFPDEISEADLNVDFPQPYIVQKGDTLWDIANHFFKEPKKWLKIWEHNLDISNPDLIFPGNEIWFNVKKKKEIIVTASPKPQILYKPVERLEPKVDSSLILTALTRQDFINADDVSRTGYILDSRDERINFGIHDQVYLKIHQTVKEDDLFDVFRTGERIEDPISGDVIGVLVDHLGTVKVTAVSNGIHSAKIVQAFEEISRGDLLKPAKNIDSNIKITYPTGNIKGHVLFIRKAIAEGGQNQIMGISLGLNEGMKPGVALSIHRSGRVIEDMITGDDIRLPEEKIGELLILVAQEKGSLALITDSTIPIHIADVVRNHQVGN